MYSHLIDYIGILEVYKKKSTSDNQQFPFLLLLCVKKLHLDFPWGNIEKGINPSLSLTVVIQHVTVIVSEQ